jgi:hypothetical protein
LPLLQHFRDLVLEGSSPGTAAALVAALVADQLDQAGGGGTVGGVAELAQALQMGAPAYFREQDRQFFQVGLYTITAAARPHLPVLRSSR